MKLMKTFLRDLASQYYPGDIIKINNKRFTSAPKLPIDIPKQVYVGIYLGQNKRHFEPSSILLQILAKEPNTNKVYVDRTTAWLFVVGKDIFDENIIDRTDGVILGGYCLVMFGEECIGYGRYETSHERQVVKNIYDIGNFLRRENA